MAKRTRIGTATTLVDTNVSSCVTSPWQYCSAPTNGLKQLVIGQSSGFESGPLSGGIFSVASPESSDVVRHGSDRLGGTLEQCFYCKRRIIGDMEVFMYSEHAFCTLPCRAIQIMADEWREKQAGKRKVLE